MATLQYLMKFMLYHSLVNLLCFSYDPIEASEIQYRIMKVNKDSQTSECVPSTRTAGTAGPMMLEVAHRYRHCSSDPSSAAEIQLSDDQLRVDHIRARLESYTKLDVDESNNATSSSLPARSGVPLGGGNYVVQFGDLGTLMFDTGSDLTWNITRYHFDHDRNHSSSSDIIECYSTECMDFKRQNTGQFQPPECKHLSECDFTIAYVDGTTIKGILTKVNLTITTTNSTHDHVDDVFPDFIMGYVDHRQQQPLGKNISGILGLSRGKFSLVSQTAEKYGECFRYCLPSNQNSTGYLAFGIEESSSSDNIIANFTPFTRQNDILFYYVEITSIFVGGTELAMIDHPVGEAIIDSGTVITYLPMDIYIAMRDKFDRIMTTGINMNYTKAPAFSILDTCYDTSNIENMSLPAVSFTFKGNVTVEFDPSRILYAINSSLSCFAFADTTYSDGIVIFGNTQQRTYEVVYDVANQRLGFRPNACN